MTGILLLLVTAIWLAVCVWLVQKIGNLLPDRPWRAVVKFALFTLLLSLPLVDEIVGGWQFKQLCKANVVHVNKDTARGRSVFLEHAAEIPVKGTWVRVWAIPYRFVDATTGELILDYDYLRAEGGALFPGSDSGHDPLTFKGVCKPVGVFEKNFLSDLGITEVKNPKPFTLK